MLTTLPSSHPSPAATLTWPSPQPTGLQSSSHSFVSCVVSQVSPGSSRPLPQVAGASLVELVTASPVLLSPVSGPLLVDVDAVAASPVSLDDEPAIVEPPATQLRDAQTRPGSQLAPAAQTQPSAPGSQSAPELLLELLELEDPGSEPQAARARASSIGRRILG